MMSSRRPRPSKSATVGHQELSGETFLLDKLQTTVAINQRQRNQRIKVGNAVPFRSMQGICFISCQGMIEMPSSPAFCPWP